MTEVSPHEQASSPEALLAEMTTEAERLLEAWNDQVAVTARPDGNGMAELGGIDEYSSVAFRYIRRTTMPGNGPAEYECTVVNPDNLANEQVLGWSQGGTTVRKGVRSRMWPEDEVQARGGELLATPEVTGQLSRRLSGVEHMLTTQAIMAARAKEQAAKHQPGKIERALGWLGLR